MECNQPVTFNRDGSVNLGRHMAQCQICRSTCREEIEDRWVNWCDTQRLAKDFNISRYTVYRHMHALGLFRKRQQNIARTLELIIERLEWTSVTGAQIVAAINAYVKLQAEEQRREPTQSANVNLLFERMTEEERVGFLQKGTLPEWFSQAIAPAPSEGAEERKEGGVLEQTTVQ